MSVPVQLPVVSGLKTDAPLTHAPEWGLPGAPLFTQIISARPPRYPAERDAGPSPWVFFVEEKVLDEDPRTKVRLRHLPWSSVQHPSFWRHQE